MVDRCKEKGNTSETEGKDVRTDKYIEVRKEGERSKEIRIKREVRKVRKKNGG
jgi:hypothetical protein